MDSSNWINIGLEHLDQEEYKEAEESYRRAIEIDPQDADFRNNPGISLNNQNKYAEAEGAYRRAIDIDPQ